MNFNNITGNFKDVTELFTDYANQWSRQNGGGKPEISLIVPGYEAYAVTSSDDRTIYHHPKKKKREKSRSHHGCSSENQERIYEDTYETNLSFNHDPNLMEECEKEIELATETYENASCHEKKIKIQIGGNVENYGEWFVYEGATLSGKDLLSIDVFGHEPVDIDQVPVSLHPGEIEVLKRPLEVDTYRSYKIRPRSKVTATLKVKQKHFKQCFDVETDVSGYVAIIQKQKDCDVQTSFHHVAAILQRYYSPFIRINGDEVTLLCKGVFKGVKITDIYIHIQIESLDIPGLIEEYNIYDVNQRNIGVME
ncbi:MULTISPECIES: hypothetical protein [Bacillus cereus group]|uniref:Crystal protein n=2 Tax=Bacillus thuringiensis TaxID=1428 RepID=Q06958_BACTU|nr:MULTISPECIES: hypothetical protein [Bacillus cereus group]AAA22332.1 crystal protein [Bacillus thuringiensis]MCR6789931.1 hypothetical protein [Bacillus thuringiensis]MCR6825911.1 hypothetical protein [Bacillus thuringiensis]MCR6831763.1 hypothetical protein [Bacillus thuringiensis]MEB9327355.1 hypothetical protein [Bacillus cereus]